MGFVVPCSSLSLIFPPCLYCTIILALNLDKTEKLEHSGNRTAFAVLNLIGTGQMKIEELRRLCDENVTVRVWPETGQALGLGRNKAYEAARSGQIPTIPLGTNMRRVPTMWLRKVTGLNST